MKTENVGIDIFQYFLFITIGERIILEICYGIIRLHYFIQFAMVRLGNILEKTIVDINKI